MTFSCYNSVVSSTWTFIYKFIILPFWTTAFLFFAAVSLTTPGWSDAVTIVVCIFSAFGAYFFIRISIPLKKVKVLENTLLISNYFSCIEVSFDQIEDVNGTIVLKPEVMWIDFKNPTLFGQRVYFIPHTRYGFLMTKHPLVDEFQYIILAEKLNRRNN